MNALRTRIGRLNAALTRARSRSRHEQYAPERTCVGVREDDLEAAVEAMEDAADLQDAARRLDRPDRRRRLRSINMRPGTLMKDTSHENPHEGTHGTAL